jgi:hypothetical protein
MCFSFWGVPLGDSRLTNQSATWLVYLRGVSISPEKTPKAKTHSVHAMIKQNNVSSLALHMKKFYSLHFTHNLILCRLKNSGETPA